MGSFIRGALHFRLLVLALAAGVLFIGAAQLRSAPVDTLPEFTPPYAEVQTEALGLSADEVEQLITVPLEADLLNGVEGIDVIRSESLPGLSSIVMVFDEGTDIYRARQLVEERLTQAHALPNVSKPPTLLQPLSSSNRVLMIGMASDKVSAIEQSVIARWTVKPRLLGVPGVANVSVWGLRDQQIQVQVDPERLRDQGVTLNQVIRSAGNAQVVSPLTFLEASTPGTGGFLETPQQRLQVRHLIEKIADPNLLGQVPVDGTNGRLQLGDVADIAVDHQPLIGDAVVNGAPGLVLVVEKFPGASTAEVSEGVEEALEALRPGLSGIRTDTSLFRPADYLEDAIGNLGIALGVGFLLMLLVLAALRFNWRSIVVAAVTVPLSLVTAAVVLRLLGEGFNAILLAGLAAALAVVVDEAVVITDRVTRRLRRPDAAGDRRAITTVVKEATEDVRGPLTYATLIILLAVVPIAVLGGRPGAFFEPLVLAYAVAVVAAVAVALTVTPVLVVVLFDRWEPGREQSPLSKRVRQGYLTGLQRFSRQLRVSLIAGGVMLLVALIAVPVFGTSLVPTFKDRAVIVQLDADPGTSNPRMTQISAELSREILELPGVESVSAHIGRAITGDRVTNVNSSEVWVRMESDADYGATVRSIRDAAADVWGVRHRVLTNTEQNIRAVGALMTGVNAVRGNDLDVLTGADQPLVVRVYGENPDVLREQAKRVQQVMADVDGVVAPRIDAPATQETIEIEVDLDRAERFGMTPGDVRRSGAALLHGLQVGSVFEEQKVFDVIVQGEPGIRSSVEGVANLLIDRPDGGHVRLGQVADVRITELAAVVSREAVSRRLDIQAGVSGRGADAVADEVEAAIAEMNFPLEYHADVLRDSTAREIGVGRVIGFAVTAAAAIFLLLQAALRSWRLAALVFACLPVSLAGGVVVALLQGGDLTLGALVGLLVVLGLTVRTSLVLVARVQTPDPEWWEAPHQTIVHRSARERLGPVVTSAAALAAFALPVAVLGGRPGLEVLHPMAVVVLGGLVTSVFVTLFVLPALYAAMPEGPRRDEPGADGDTQRVIDLERTEVPAYADGDGMPGQRRTSADAPGRVPSP